MITQLEFYAHAQRLVQARALRAVLNGAAPQDATFRLFDRRCGPEPVAGDFVFVNDSLAGAVKHVQVDLQTRAPDPQPMHLSL